MSEAITGIESRGGRIRDAVRGRAPGAEPRAAARPQPVLRAGADQAHRWREDRRAAMSGAAALLHSMIEQMGGAETSFPKGSFVRLTV